MKQLSAVEQCCTAIEMMLSTLLLCSGVIRTSPGVREGVGLCFGILDILLRSDGSVRAETKRSCACLGWKVNWLQFKLYPTQPN